MGYFSRNQFPLELDPLFCMNVQKKFEENLKDFAIESEKKFLQIMKIAYRIRNVSMNAIPT